MREHVLTFVAMMGVLGIPSIFSLTIWCVKACHNFGKQLSILMEAQQKQMARDLTVDYKSYMAQGWIDTEDWELWESNYQKYHMLGANGVMDSKRTKLMALPNIPPTKAKKGLFK